MWLWLVEEPPCRGVRYVEVIADFAYGPSHVVEFDGSLVLFLCVGGVADVEEQSFVACGGVVVADEVQGRVVVLFDESQDSHIASVELYATVARFEVLDVEGVVVDKCSVECEDGVESVG